MKYQATRTALAATAVLLTLIGLPLVAPAQEGVAEMPTPSSSDQSAPMTQHHQAMAHMQKQLMARHQAMSARLDQMMAAVQKAQGDEKIAAMEALLGELVDQTKSMHMMAMQGSMMMGMGMRGMGAMRGHPMTGGHGMMKHDCPMGPDCPMVKGATATPAPETPPAKPEE